MSSWGMDFNDRITSHRVIRTRSAHSDGRLFIGVTSTGIHCRPICRARALAKPLQFADTHNEETS